MIFSFHYFKWNIQGKASSRTDSLITELHINCFFFTSTYQLQDQYIYACICSLKIKSILTWWGVSHLSALNSASLYIVIILSDKRNTLRDSIPWEVFNGSEQTKRSINSSGKEVWCRRYYMAAWRYKILFKYWKIFSQYIKMFLVIFWRFLKIVQNLSKGQTNVLNIFLTIFKDNQRLLKTSEEDLKMLWSYTNKFKCS